MIFQIPRAGKSLSLPGLKKRLSNSKDLGVKVCWRDWK